MQVNDSFPFSISLSWKGENGVESNTLVFPKGNPLPSLKVLTFYRASTFSVDAVYIDHPTKISTYTVSAQMLARASKMSFHATVYFCVVSFL
jgi:heat shock 70kDa protein 4